MHASAFSRDGTRPTIGERVTYVLGRGRDGRPQATNVVRLAIGEHPPLRLRKSASQAPRRNWAGTALLLALIAATATYGYSRFSAQQARSLAEQPAAPSPPVPAAAAAANPGLTARFRCDGRTYCSQMTSCAEATWFVNHCPGTQMDGNHDGIPCEQQWCPAPFTR